MKRVLVTGSAGHLGEALTRVLRGDGYEVVGLDLRASPGTDVGGSITERALVRECLDGASAVLHAATLHKPHVGSHGKQDFVAANVSGTLVLLEEAAAARQRPADRRLYRGARQRRRRETEAAGRHRHPGAAR